MGLDVVIYMGAVDVQRQAANVARMELCGARVVAVDAGSATLKDAILALDATRQPDLQGARLLYMAKLKLDVPETLIEEVFAARPRTNF